MGNADLLRGHDVAFLFRWTEILPRRLQHQVLLLFHFNCSDHLFHKRLYQKLFSIQHEHDAVHQHRIYTRISLPCLRL